MGEGRQEGSAKAGLHHLGLLSPYREISLDLQSPGKPLRHCFCLGCGLSTRPCGEWIVEDRPGAKDPLGR